MRDSEERQLRQRYNWSDYSLAKHGLLVGRNSANVHLVEVADGKRRESDLVYGVVGGVDADQGGRGDVR